LFRFALQLKTKQQHIKQFLTLVMLWVFSLAITPWSALHHHEDLPEVAAEQHCTHKFHVKNSQENCLICAAHFEKNYVQTNNTFRFYVKTQLLVKPVSIVKSTYTALISTSLRGPPAFA